MSIQTDDFLSVKEYSKIIEYKDQETEIEKMW